MATENKKNVSATNTATTNSHAAAAAECIAAIIVDMANAVDADAIAAVKARITDVFALADAAADAGKGAARAARDAIRATDAARAAMLADACKLADVAARCAAYRDALALDAVKLYKLAVFAGDEKRANAACKLADDNAIRAAITEKGNAAAVLAYTFESVCGKKRVCNWRMVCAVMDMEKADIDYMKANAAIVKESAAGNAVRAVKAAAAMLEKLTSGAKKYDKASETIKHAQRMVSDVNNSLKIDGSIKSQWNDAAVTGLLVNLYKETTEYVVIAGTKKTPVTLKTKW